MRPLVLFTAAFVFAMPCQGQGRLPLWLFNKHLAGQVVDHTWNHGSDRRIFSPVLGQHRDVYVYLPPGYDPCRRYPLMIWFHGAFGDEHSFLSSHPIRYLDRLIRKGLCPPIIVAAPDVSYQGVNRLNAQHSFGVNGLGGRYDDFIMGDLLSFLFANYSIEPDRKHHVVAGSSAGAMTAMSLALRHRESFSIVMALSGPLNLRYGDQNGRRFPNFNPETMIWRTEYDPRDVVGQYALGLVKIRAGWMVERVFGFGDDLVERVIEVNPADMLVSRPLARGEMEMYLNYSSHDNFNFDAQVESFAWIARQQGLDVTLVRDNLAWHKVPYFKRNERIAYDWLANVLLNREREVSPKGSEPE